MKKFFAVFAMFGILSFGLSQTVVAQNEVAAQTETVDTAAVDTAAVDSAAVEAPAEVVPVEEETVGMHKALKTKFIEGDGTHAVAVLVHAKTGKVTTTCIRELLVIDSNIIRKRSYE